MTQIQIYARPAQRLMCAGFLFLSAAALRLATFKAGSPTPTVLPSPFTPGDSTPSPTADVSTTPTPVATDIPQTETPSADPSQTLPPASPTGTTSPSPPPTSTGTIGFTPTPPPSAQPSPTGTIAPFPSPTTAPPPTPTASSTQTNTATPNPPSFPPLALLISEVAWAGTRASAYDEWIELHNPGDQQIDLEGWRLSDGGDIDIQLHGRIAPFSFFLLERTDDSTIANIAADQVYTGNLSNSGERLELRDPSGLLIDSANQNGGGWPAGEAGLRFSMERLGGDDRAGNWATFPGFGGNGVDADGNPIGGTPRQPNAIWFPPEPSASPTTTPSPTPTEPDATPVPPGSILINEIAWSGTMASASDEWIELRNDTDHAIDLTGWTLTDGDDVNVALSGVIPPNNFFLLERTDDSCISDVSADQIYSGSLRNSGEHLHLLDPGGALIDSANHLNGSWPAGDSSRHASMERRGGQDLPGNWGTFTGYFGIGHDASGNAIQGTPRGTNSLHFPTPQPTWIPGKVVINEVLIRPHYDWQGTGGVSPDDEFIELINLGPFPVNLRGWALDDIPGAGSAPFTLPGRTLQPGELTAFFRSKSHIALNDSGDTVRLLDPSGKLVDSITYLRIRAANLSYGRFPDGSDTLVYGLWPTPRSSNLLFAEVIEAFQPKSRRVCEGQTSPDLRVPRLMRPGIHLSFVRAPAQIRCPISDTVTAHISLPSPRFH